MRCYIFMLIVSLGFPLISHAQFCTGTLGDNIFPEGDFGIGGANLLSPNPNIAPGYIYTFNVPPQDGEYVITNNTNSWSGLYPSWLGIGDNSNDPNGYMMVVNASNAPGLFYQQTVSGLCENTLYEFSADIINLIKTGTPDHIDPDVSFLLDGVDLFSTGNIAKTNNWTTYGFTFTTGVGQQSLTLSLRNNAPGGNGNDLAIDNISFRPCGPEILISPENLSTLCEDGSPIEWEAIIIGNQYVNPAFQWQQSLDQGMTWMDISGANGATYTSPQLAAGMYYYRFLAADGLGNLGSDKCRVISDVKIINVLQKETMISDTICDGLTLMIGNSTYSETGIYVDTLLNILGCDSILTTDLTVLTDANFAGDFVVTTPSCSDLADGSISIENVSGGIPPFQYIFEGMNVGTTSFFSDLLGGETYSVIIQDNVGCIIETPIFMEEGPDLLLELGENQVIELGETVELSPIYNFTPSGFNWQSITPIDCLDFEDCQDFSFLPSISQQVTLDLFAGTGCSISDSIFIEVVEVRKVWLPNVFSPNNDGINDIFTVFGETSNVQMVEEFKIFNRWGSLIFESENFFPNDMQNGWNGTFNGERMPVGVYVYTATVRFADEKVLRYSGDVLLLK
ncbi:MAG: gliding motility-associated C-terminal domain-containing protein [Bacteroidetes bacterium]|nr:gliding motility-associated C-terminal domain-containing protein [Bacteroidota bacterium]